MHPADRNSTGGLVGTSLDAVGVGDGVLAVVVVETDGAGDTGNDARD